MAKQNVLPPMQITVDVSRAVFEDVINSLVWEMEEHDAGARKTAGVDVAAIRKQVEQDPKVLDRIKRDITKHAINAVRDQAGWGNIGVTPAYVKTAIRKLDRAYNANNEHATHSAAISMLRSAGYKVTKP